MKVDQLIELNEEILSNFAHSRQLGNTTSLVQLVTNNKNSILVVESYFHKNLLINENPQIKKRIFTLGEFYKMRGLKLFPVFDNHALNTLLNEVNSKLRKYNKLREMVQELALE